MTVAKCSQCGDGIEEGDFCYRLGEVYVCRDCVKDAAVIAGRERGIRESVQLPVRRERRWGSFIEREIDMGCLLRHGRI